MSRHILVVEDTIDLRINIIELLHMEGYEVSWAAHGKQAIQLLEKIKPQLIITDLLMPELDGFELIEYVREQTRWKKIPILVFTAMPAHENEMKVLKLGANSYLKKPSTLDELLTEVKKLLGNN